MGEGGIIKLNNIEIGNANGAKARNYEEKNESRNSLVSGRNRWTGKAQNEEVVRMKVKYIKETSFMILTHGKIYDVLSIEKGWYRIIDDSREDYLYPPEAFEIVEE